MSPRKKGADLPRKCAKCGALVHTAMGTNGLPVILDAKMPRRVYMMEHFADTGLRASYRPGELAGHTQAFLMEHWCGGVK